MSRAGDRRVVVVGAGLGGLAAALAALQAGAGEVVLLEGRGAVGGASADSAGWIWRYRTLAHARRCASGGDPSVQASIVAGLDDSLAWLRAVGVAPVATDTGRSLTVGIRVEPRACVERMAAAFTGEGRARLLVGTRCTGAERLDDGRIRVHASSGALDADAVVLAGGGYAADLDRIALESEAPASARSAWVVRTPNGGDGSTLDIALGLGADRRIASGESLVRLVPDLPDGAGLAAGPVPFGELHGPGATLVGADGVPIVRAEHDWSGAWADWRFARASGRGRLEFDQPGLERRVHAGLVREIVAAALATGCEGQLGPRAGWLAVRAGFTHTRTGVVVDRSGTAAPRAFAVGADAEGGDLGGIASGLAQALVLGRAAGTRAARGD